jgi:hypothetical protein
MPEFKNPLGGRFNIELKSKGRFFYWRIINLLIGGILAGGIMLTFYFIQQSIFSAIANANAIVSLQSSANLDIIDLPAFEQATKNIALKSVKIKIEPDIRNIFVYGGSQSITAPSSSKQ